MRGEYENRTKIALDLVELPPRARRIPPRVIAVRVCLGTTSACAENTLPRLRRYAGRRNYLRVRGEYGATRARHVLT